MLIEGNAYLINAVSKWKASENFNIFISSGLTFWVTNMSYILQHYTFFYIIHPVNYCNHLSFEFPTNPGGFSLTSSIHL